MQVTQVIGYVLIVGVLLPWAGSRRRRWPCVFVVGVSAFTTPLVAAGVAGWLRFPIPEWFGPLGVVWCLVAYACLVVWSWSAGVEVVTIGGIGYRLGATVRRSLVGASRRRAAVRDVRRAVRGQQTLDYRIEVE